MPVIRLYISIYLASFEFYILSKMGIEYSYTIVDYT